MCGPKPGARTQLVAAAQQAGARRGDEPRHRRGHAGQAAHAAAAAAAAAAAQLRRTYAARAAQAPAHTAQAAHWYHPTCAPPVCTVRPLSLAPWKRSHGAAWRQPTLQPWRPARSAQAHCVWKDKRGVPGCGREVLGAHPACAAARRAAGRRAPWRAPGRRGPAPGSSRCSGPSSRRRSPSARRAGRPPQSATRDGGREGAPQHASPHCVNCAEPFPGCSKCHQRGAGAREAARPRAHPLRRHRAGGARARCSRRTPWHAAGTIAEQKEGGQGPGLTLAGQGVAPAAPAAAPAACPCPCCPPGPACAAPRPAARAPCLRTDARGRQLDTAPLDSPSTRKLPPHSGRSSAARCASGAAPLRHTSMQALLGPAHDAAEPLACMGQSAVRADPLPQHRCAFKLGATRAPCGARDTQHLC